jgi:hypothetical protein
MTAKTKTQLQEENKEQIAAFRKAARQLGCEPDERRFQDALRRVAKAKPSAEKKQGKSSRAKGNH